ncbi:MAG: HNH endonuclease signature motif containing protein [Candidatus Thalassarchaeaceae archaeon]|nr:HNH endonuclease signature motif containing protein [Candidatus Thalassarchaeaceae archaeon]
MANRRSPFTRLPDDILQERRIAHGASCGICQQVDKTSIMRPDHIMPLNMGGGDVPENIRYICQMCNDTRKFTIRIPKGLANRVLQSNELPISELVRVALIEYFDKHTQNQSLEIINLKQQNRVLRARLDAVKKAFDHNPFEHYIRNKN